MRPVWPAALLAATLAASCDKLGPGNSGTNPNAPTPPAAGSTINYTAIGASDALGVGSSGLCLPFVACPNGMGYPNVAAQSLKAQGFTVNLANYGIPTAVIGRDFQTLGLQYGRTIEGNFIDQEMPFVPASTTVVTVFAGGNDVNTITSALGHGAGGADPAGYIDQQVKAFGADYSTLIAGIRNRASGARIIVLNLPNLGALPYLSGASVDQRQAAQRASVAMTTTVINPLQAQSIPIVDLMCDARAYARANMSSDGFHPNDSGYAFIAAEIVKAMTNASYPSPLSNCAQMTAVP